MRGRGLSRVHPRERRRRLWRRALLAAALLVLAALAGWWGRRPAVEAALRAWLAGTVGGQTQVEVFDIGLTAARMGQIEHAQPGWTVAAEGARLGYRWRALREGKLDTVEVEKLRVARLDGGPETGWGLPVMDWPLGTLRISDATLDWPGLPVGLRGSVLAARTDAEVAGTVLGELPGGSWTGVFQWTPEAGALVARIQGQHKDPHMLDVGGLVPTPVRLGSLTWDAIVEWGVEGPQRWGASLTLEHAAWKAEETAEAWVVAPLEVGLRGTGPDLSAAVLGGRLQRRNLAGMQWTVGPWILEGSPGEALRFEAADGNVSRLGGAGEIAWAIRGTLELPTGEAVLADPGAWRAAKASLEAVIRAPWHWGGLRGGRVRSVVNVGPTGGQLRASDLDLSAPWPLQLGGISAEWENDTAGNPQRISGSGTVHLAEVPADCRWDGEPMRVSGALDLESGTADLVALQEPGALVWVAGEHAATGEVGGSVWLHGPMNELNAWGGEGSIVVGRADLLLAGWQASGVIGEVSGRLHQWLPLDLDDSDWLAEPAAAIARVTGWLEQAGLSGQAVASISRVDGPNGFPITAEGISVSIGRESGLNPTLEAEAARVRHGSLQAGDVRARLGWTAGRPTLALSGHTVPDRLTLNAVLAAEPEGGWTWAGEIKPLVREIWSPLPNLLPAAEVSWRGEVSATAAGSLGQATPAPLQAMARIAVDLLWGGDDPVRLTGLQAEFAGSWGGQLETLGTQVVRLATLRSGDLVLTDLEARWSAAGDGGITLEHATASWLGGALSMGPVTWTAEDGAEAKLMLAGVSLAGLSTLWPEIPVRAEGTVDGWIALAWKGGSLVVGEGELILRREGEPRLEVRHPGWLTSRAAPRSREFRALETVERAAEDLLLESLEIRIHDPGRPLAPVWLKVAGRTQVPGIEAPITLEVNLDVALNQLINSKLWRLIEWR